MAAAAPRGDPPAGAGPSGEKPVGGVPVGWARPDVENGGGHSWGGLGGAQLDMGVPRGGPDQPALPH